MIPQGIFVWVSACPGSETFSAEETELRTRSPWSGLVTQPGIMTYGAGRVLVLEFSKPNFGPLDRFYDMYSFRVLPKLGQLLANDAASYQYLAESIRKHPDQEQLKTLMMEQGFDRQVPN